MKISYETAAKFSQIWAVNNKSAAKKVKQKNCVRREKNKTEGAAQTVLQILFIKMQQTKQNEKLNLFCFI